MKRNRIRTVLVSIGALAVPASLAAIEPAAPRPESVHRFRDASPESTVAPQALAGTIANATTGRAREIIEHAIARNRDALAGIRDVRYDGHVRFTARDPGKPSDSAESIVLIRETRNSVYWEAPGRYQERILARRQTGNPDPERDYVTVGGILDFDRDRIDLRKYSIVSPIAADALEHYVYAIVDTLEVAAGSVIRLAVTPRTEAVPLFAGVIDIIDSTWEVLGIDVGINAATRFTYADDLRYRQRFRRTADGRWVPHEIRLTGVVRLALRLPGMPRNVAFEHVASFDAFRFNQGDRPPDLLPVRIVADDQESEEWGEAAGVPLTVAERAAWARADSIARLPGIGRRIGRALGFAVSRAGDPDFFRFNRADGAYVGAAHDWRPHRRGPLWNTGVGYAFASHRLQYRVGGRVPVVRSHDLRAGASYHDGTLRRPTFVSATYNPTVLALGERLDPLDYHRERGFTVSASAQPIPFVRVGLRYQDVEQSSLPVATGFALLGADRPQRPNPPIADGRLRSIEARLGFDSRPVRRSKGGDNPLSNVPFTRLSVTAEIADPELVANDFSFRRFEAEFERRQRTPGLGHSTVRAAVGVGLGDLPPQRYFGVDFGPDIAYQGIAYQGDGFNTLGETNFSGNRAIMLIVHHDFDRLLFQRSSHPRVQSIPFTLSINGGVFWTDFVNHAADPADSLLNTARRPYVEVGIGIGNLTPFFSPFNLEANLTTQLSSYRTQRVQFGLDLTP